MNLDQVLERVRVALDLPGVLGLVLGGSRARGTASPNSDIDVGLYYDGDAPPDFDAILAAASGLDDDGIPLGHGRYGEWGPWINGGVWLRVDGTKLDILLRDTGKVRHVLRECAAGRPEIVYQAGHPHGFCSAIYAGEVHQNVPFSDPHGVMAELLALVDPYPVALSEALVRRFGWEAGFSLGNASSAAQRGDIAYVTGCAFRAVACLTQVLFAAEKHYLTNEKGSVAIASGFASAPDRYAQRVADALAVLSPRPEDLQRGLAELRALHDEVRLSWR